MTALPAPDGRSVVYPAWTQLRADDPARSWSEQGIADGDVLARPDLRIRDLITGADQVLAIGASSAAWAGDGRFAYVSGSPAEYRAYRDWTGVIRVAAQPGAPTVSWTSTPGSYTVLAWAGPRLLAYRTDDLGQRELVVFDGPGAVRSLGRYALLALGPDGGRAAVLGEDQGPVIRVLDLKDALVQAEYRNPDPSWSAAAGDWLGDQIVVQSGHGFTVFTLADGTPKLLQAVDVSAGTAPGDVYEPHFSTAQTVVIWAVRQPAERSGTAALGPVACRLIDRVCTPGPAYRALFAGCCSVSSDWWSVLQHFLRFRCRCALPSWWVWVG